MPGRQWLRLQDYAYSIIEKEIMKNKVYNYIKNGK